MKIDENMEKLLIYIVLVSQTSQMFRWCPWDKMFCDV